MKKHFLIATAISGLLVFGAQSAFAQNVAIVNGKAVPKTRLDTLAQQVAKSGRPLTPEIEANCVTKLLHAKCLCKKPRNSGYLQPTSSKYKWNWRVRPF